MSVGVDATVGPQPVTVLVPTAMGGAGLAAARRMRLVAANGAVTLTRRDGSVEVLCGVDEIRRIVRVEDGLWDSRVLIVAGRVAWELPEDGWAPGGHLGRWSLTGRRRMAALGVAGLARVTGVPVRFAGPDGSATPAGRGVRVVRVDPRPRPPVWVRVLGLACLAVWVVGFIVLVVDAAWTQRLAVPMILAIGWAFLLTPAAWLAGTATAAAWRSWPRGVPRLPEVPQGALLWQPEPAGAASRRFRRECWLLVGEREIAVRSSFGIEGWLPGPAGGGVRRAFLVGRSGAPDRQLQLARDDGSVLMVLPLADWAGTPGSWQRLSEALARCGVRVEERPREMPGHLDAGVMAAPTGQRASWDRPRYADDMDVFLPLFLSMCAQAYAVRGGVTPSSVVGAVPLVGFAAAVAWRRWRDRTDARTRQPARTETPGTQN